MRRGIRGLLAVIAVLGVSASVAQASLTVPFQTFTSLAQFEAAIGGSDNGTTPGEQNGGFRHWVPAGIALDGSQPGTTAIPGGHTAALAPGFLQPWGMELGPAVAVANDGFKSVNSNAGPTNGFNPVDLWAPFNSHTVDVDVVTPAAQASMPAPALTRGLGVEFVHVQNPDTTISYYSGDGLLGQLTAPTGATSFAGMLFGQPVVTRVVITLGTAEIFDYNGSTVTPGSGPANTLAAAEDVVVAEPGAGEPTVAATAGVPVSPVLASFNSSDAAGQISGAIDWGDGTRSSGTIAGGSAAGFTLTGSHSYAQPGSYTGTATVQDSGGSELTTQVLVQIAPGQTTTSVSCSPSDVAVSATTACTATVRDVDAGNTLAPSGLVTFSTPTAGAAFPVTSSCVLGSSGSGTSFCQVQLMPGQIPPIQARITASYAGDAAHVASGGDATVAVHGRRCALRALSKRLRAGGFGVLVTCDARTSVQIVAQAHAARNARHRAFQLRFGSAGSVVQPGRPTVLVIKAAGGVLPALRAALHRRQRVSLKLTLAVGSPPTHKSTTKRVSLLRLS
jgi:hypothetical protein